MILTEDEAKTKRCAEGLKEPNGKLILNCIGSACMAWRWKRGSYYGPHPNDPQTFIEHEALGEYSETRGYCGKAGRP